MGSPFQLKAKEKGGKLPPGQGKRHLKALYCALLFIYVIYFVFELPGLILVAGFVEQAAKVILFTCQPLHL